MLDLRRDGLLSIDDAKIISSIQTEVRSEYNDFVKTLVISNQISDLQWLLQVTTRNTYASWIYDSMCRLKFLEFLLQEGRKINLIKIDNKDRAFKCDSNDSKKTFVNSGTNTTGRVNFLTGKGKRKKYLGVVVK